MGDILQRSYIPVTLALELGAVIRITQRRIIDHQWILRSALRHVT